MKLPLGMWSILFLFYCVAAATGVDEESRETNVLLTLHESEDYALLSEMRVQVNELANFYSTLKPPVSATKTQSQAGTLPMTFDELKYPPVNSLPTLQNYLIAINAGHEATLGVINSIITELHKLQNSQSNIETIMACTTKPLKPGTCPNAQTAWPTLPPPVTQVTTGFGAGPGIGFGGIVGGGTPWWNSFSGGNSGTGRPPSLSSGLTASSGVGLGQAGEAAFNGGVGWNAFAGQTNDGGTWWIGSNSAGGGNVSGKDKLSGFNSGSSSGVPSSGGEITGSSGSIAQE